MILKSINLHRTPLFLEFSSLDDCVLGICTKCPGCTITCWKTLVGVGGFEASVVVITTLVGGGCVLCISIWVDTCVATLFA